MRNLLQVIDAMVLQIPDHEEKLLADLETIAKDNRYRAPECQDWRRTADTLALRLEPIRMANYTEEVEWSERVLKIWMDEA